MDFPNIKRPSDVFSEVSRSKSKKYGKPSVMDKYRKNSISDDEKEFRQKGGIETLAYRGRKISDQSKPHTASPQINLASTVGIRQSNAFADKDLQTLASDFVKEQPIRDQARIKKDVADEIISQRNPQMHMGEPSSFKERETKKIFGKSILTKR